MNVEFHFDFGSPNAYLSHLVIPAIEARTGVSFTYIPVLIGGVFKATGNVSPAVSFKGIRNKAEYHAIETQRFLQTHGITQYQQNPWFPVNTLQIMRGAVFASQQSYYHQYIDQVFADMWAQPKKMDETDIVRRAFDAAGLPTDEILTGSQLPETKQMLMDNTQRSVEMGAFGSPTFFVENEIFFGKDKLVDVETEINQQK